MHYFEDLAVGQRFTSTNSIRVDEERLKAFAQEFDPQPFHLDDQAAQNSIFQGLAASGWHTAAITMRLYVESEFQPVGGVVGAGIEELRWPLPVRPGDVLRVEIEVLEVRALNSKPALGLAKMSTTTFNQNNQVVQSHVANLIIQKRPAPASAS